LEGYLLLNILVVEDNENLRQLMCIHLIRAGYSVFEAGSGIDALDILERVAIHLIVADIMMPKMDGYELTGELRGAGITIPVLLVTAKETLEDKRKGFKTGVDDYMVKPIAMEELLLRVEALLRRSNLSGRHILSVGDSILNSESLMVTCGECIISLPQKEFLLLHTLLSYPNKIFTRIALMDEIWGYGSETDPRTVDVHIKRLREKFSGSPDFEIETVRGLGYRAVIKR
jgi:DNA-binding response OmpR family regulator